MRSIGILISLLCTCFVSAEWLRAQMPASPSSVTRIIPQLPPWSTAPAAQWETQAVPAQRRRINDASGGAVPFDLLDGFLIVVEGRIGPLNHLRFLLDTGVTRTVVDRKVADRLHLLRRPKQVLNYSRSVAVDWATISDVQFGPIQVNTASILIADLADFSELGDADVLVGYDLLHLTNFAFDYNARQVIFTPVKQHSSEASIRPAPDYLTALTVELQVQGHPLCLIVDTGLQGMVLFEDRVVKRIPELRFEGGVEPASFGKHLRAKRKVLRKVHLGTKDRDIRVLLLKDPPEDQVPGIDGFLGIALLNARWIKFNATDNEITWR